MGQMTDDAIPVGERLGSERLYEQSIPTLPGGGLFAVPPMDGPSQPKPPTERPKREKQEKQAKQPPAPTQKSPTLAKLADVNWRGLTSSCLEIAGIAGITAGCALIALWLAFVVGGILLVVLGVAMGLQVTK